MTEYVIKKRLNNNVLLAHDRGGNPVILIGRGIGFQARENAIFREISRVEQTFVLYQRENQSRFREILQGTDPELIAIIEECLKKFQQQCPCPINENIHNTLTDHVAFALERHRRGIDFHNPFNESLKYVYPEEYRFAQEIIKQINAYYQTDLIDDEIGIVAIHLRAAKQNESLQFSRKQAKLIEETVSALYNLVDAKPDEHGLTYQRLLIHCRFAYERILKKEPMDDAIAALIQKEYSSDFKAVKQILDQIADKNNLVIPESEAAYLVIHLKRLQPDETKN